MSSIVLQFELADVNDIKEVRVSKDWKVPGFFLILQKSTNPQNKHFGEQEFCTEFCRTVVV